MADDWDDWGDDEDENSSKSAANVSISSEKSEGWEWPSTAAIVPSSQDGRQQEERSAALEQGLEARDAAVEEMTGFFFAELRKYLEDLADPSVREGINKVCVIVVLLVGRLGPC